MKVEQAITVGYILVDQLIQGQHKQRWRVAVSLGPVSSPSPSELLVRFSLKQLT
jgi:hypothetical protein